MELLGGAMAVFWGLAGAWHAWYLLRWRRLPVARESSERDAPPISVLLPARNEAGRMLAECVHSLLAQEYPGTFEIIAVDDCSTDGTGTVLKRISETNHRLYVLDGAEPPPGWVGKTWALEQAARKATGDWLLVVDADTWLAPTLLRDALQCAQRENWDALTLLPRLGTNAFLVQAAMPVYEWIVVFGLPLVHRDGAGDGKASACGAFFLIRRAALAAVGGFDSVRAFVAEDIALARRLKANGFRLTYQRATDRFWTPHYRDARELRQGFAKNLWTPGFGVGRGLILAALLLALALGPWMALSAGHPLAAGVQLLALAPAYVGTGKGALPWRVIFAPLVLAALALIVLANIARVRRGRGLLWKDRALHSKKR